MSGVLGATDPGWRKHVESRKNYTGFVIMLIPNMFRGIWQSQKYLPSHATVIRLRQEPRGGGPAIAAAIE